MEREPGDMRTSRDAAPRQLVRERPQVHVGVGGCHRRARCTRTWSCSTASPRRAGAGSRCETCSGHAPRRGAGPARPRPVRRGGSRHVRGLRRVLRALTDAPFTLVGYSMGAGSRCTRARRRSAGPAPGARRREPGLADAAERDAAPRADAALADRIEAIGAEAFAREWAASRSSPACRAGSPTRSTPTAVATRPRARRGAARAGHGRDAAALGTARELAMPSTSSSGSATRSSRRSPSGWPSVSRPRRCTSSPRRGHVAHLEQRARSPSCSERGSASRSSRPGPWGSRSRPPAARARRRALRTSRASRAARRSGRVAPSAAAACRPRRCQRPVERRCDVDLAARRPRRRRVAQEPRDPAAAGDFRHTASVAPEPRRPARPPSRPSPAPPATPPAPRRAPRCRARLLGVLDPDRRERAQVRERLLRRRPRAVRVDAHRHAGAGGGAHRGDPARVVADPDLDLHAAEPAAAAAAACGRGAGAVLGADRRVDRDSGVAAAARRSATGRPARRPRDPRARGRPPRAPAGARAPPRRPRAAHRPASGDASRSTAA